MKNVLSLGLVFILTVSFAGFGTKPKLHPSNDKIEVFFNNKLSFNDLVKMKSDLSQQQIELDYQLLEFDNDKKLKVISFRVISEGMYCGSGKTANLQHSYGFSIDRSPNAPFYFQVGLTRD